MYMAIVVQSVNLALLLGMVSASPLLFDTLYTQVEIEPEVFMSATELITSKGYPCENHYVTTEDGYILNVLRIRHGLKNADPTADRPVVVLQHGLGCSANTWLVNPANESLGYILADAGADVWLGNSRGNVYSINHTHLNTKSSEFWDFSWDEMAKYDLPAMIKFVVSKSGAQQVYYVGHSQGSTIAFARLSEDQELASYIKHIFALAPMARADHTTLPIAKLTPFLTNKVFLTINFGHGDFILEPEYSRFLKGRLCARSLEICKHIFLIFSGMNSINMTRLPVYMAHGPVGTSTKTMLHWIQEINSKKFRKYDYESAEENIKHYNQPTPPLYNPTNIKVPVTIIRGGRDKVSTDKDNDWLLPQLNLVKDVYIKSYRHHDFTLAFDAASVFYDEIVKVVIQK